MNPRFLVTVSAVTEPTWLETRHDHPGDRPGGKRRRKHYLPSEQVVKELASLGTDLSTLAEELRNRLSDPQDTGR
jgi:hypothetical protein